MKSDHVRRHMDAPAALRATGTLFCEWPELVLEEFIAALSLRVFCQEEYDQGATAAFWHIHCFPLRFLPPGGSDPPWVMAVRFFQVND